MEEADKDVLETEGQIETPEVTEEVSSPSPDQETDNASTEDTPQDKPKKQRVPLDELIKERQRRRELEQRLEELESKVVKSTQPNKVKEIMEDFGVDEDTAKKLHKHIGGQSQASPELEMMKLQEKFAKRAKDVAEDYSDWDDYRTDMETLFTQTYQKDPRSALNENPETYYLKARLLREQKEKETSVREVIDKSNSKNLAGMESGKNSSGRPKPAHKWTRENIKKAMKDGTYEKHREEILSLLQSGRIKD